MIRKPRKIMLILIQYKLNLFLLDLDLEEVLKKLNLDFGLMMIWRKNHTRIQILVHINLVIYWIIILINLVSIK